MCSSSDGYVCLRGGLAVPVMALALLLDLERRGLQLTLVGDEQIAVHPSSRLTDADVAGLRRWRAHLRALMAYQPPRPQFIHQEGSR